MTRRRVVVTGIGAITAVGLGRDGLWQGVLRGASSVRTLTRFDPAPYRRGRVELRQREAVPVWKTLERWLASDRVQRAALPRSPFGKAVGYMRNQWDVLQRYLTDGELPFDNNQAERAIRPLAVGRRNWLFFGHPQAAASRLRLMSIVSSAHRHNLVVEDYLADILQQLADAAQNDPAKLQAEFLADLLPDQWASKHPTSIRKQRVAEKVDRQDAKRARRARQRILARQRRKAAARK